MSNIVKFPVDQLDLNGLDLTDDQKDRIVLALQGRALKNPVQDAIDRATLRITEFEAAVEADDYDNIGSGGQTTTKLAALQTAINNLKTHTDILSGVTLNYTGFPPNFLGRLSIATAYNQIKEGLRKTQDGVCGVEENKDEIYSEVFRSLLGYAENELDSIINYFNNINLETGMEVASAIETFIDNVNDFKTQDTAGFYKAYNFVTRVGLAQALANSKTNDYANKLFEDVIGTRIFNTEDIAALKLQCQVWGDDSTPPPSDFSSNFGFEFALQSVGDLIGISLGGATEGDILQISNGDILPTARPDLGLNLDDLGNISGAASGSIGQALVKDASGKYAPATISSGGGGSTTWIGLSDTPGSITADKFVKSNVGGTALEFVTLGESDIPSVFVVFDDLADVAESGLYSDLTGSPVNLSDFTNDSSFITGNQTITLSGDVTGSGATAITTTVIQSAVTQHQAALSITESQISDLGSYSEVGHAHAATSVTSGFITPSNYTATNSNLSGHLEGLDNALGAVGGTDLSGSDTGDLAEGSNLYYTDERVDDRVSVLIVGGNNLTVTYDDGAGSLTIDVDSLIASDITSGTLDDARLSSNVGMLNVGAQWTAGQQFNSISVTGSGGRHSIISEATTGKSATIADVDGYVPIITDLTPADGEFLVRSGDGYISRDLVEADISDLGTYYSSGDTILSANGASNAVGLGFASDTDTGLFLDAANSMYLVAGGLNIVNINETAGVGLVTVDCSAFSVTSTITWGAIAPSFDFVNSSSTSAATIKLFEGTDNGSNSISLSVSDSLPKDKSWVIPVSDAANGVWKSDGAGILECAAITFGEIGGSVGDAQITESNVTQHEAALSITESQVSDLGTYYQSSDFAGTSYPLSPYDGQKFVRTDLENETFTWDATRSKWLGELICLVAARSSAASSGSLDLRTAGGVQYSGSRGECFPDDMTIVGVTVYSAANWSGDVDWIEGNTKIATLITTANDRGLADMSLNIDFDGDNGYPHKYPKIQNITGGSVNNPIIRVFLRKNGTSL